MVFRRCAMQRMVRSANACEMVSYARRQQGTLGTPKGAYLDLAVRLVVHGGRSLVQNEDFGVAHEGASKSHERTLSTHVSEGCNLAEHLRTWPMDKFPPSSSTGLSSVNFGCESRPSTDCREISSDGFFEPTGVSETRWERLSASHSFTSSCSLKGSRLSSRQHSFH
jgi:hypothetical protein